ncbi:MAG: high light inducible protein [Euryarchaeota archaeon]|mgnify:CR=1 FL=1|nr:high light inducible protein [Euryarchaeota archaeon]
MSSSHITTEYGKQNIFAKETQPQLVDDYKGQLEEAELANGRWAMIGFVALIGAYLTTGQVLPGIF